MSYVSIVGAEAAPTSNPEVLSMLPSHLFVSSTDGALYDTRVPSWHHKRPLRYNFHRTSSQVHNAADVKAALRSGAFTEWGCYPLYFLTADGEALSFESVRANLAEVLGAFNAADRHNGWRVVGVEINHEDGELICCHSNKRIPSAYAD
jgi:hypothetical protein